MEVFALLAAMAIGAASALPPVLALRGARPSVSRGLAAMATSFALITGVIVLVRALLPAMLVPLSSLVVLTFVTVVSVCALRPRR